MYKLSTKYLKSSFSTNPIKSNIIKWKSVLFLWTKKLEYMEIESCIKSRQNILIIKFNNYIEIIIIKCKGEFSILTNIKYEMS